MGEDELLGVRAVDQHGTPDGMVTRPYARFLGGPLDGRYHPFVGDGEPTEGHVVTYVYLHDGPKIETRYRLVRDQDGDWAYHLID